MFKPGFLELRLKFLHGKEEREVLAETNKTANVFKEISLLLS